MRISILKHITLFTGAWFALSAMVGGCHCTVHNHSTTTPQPVYVKTPPPAPRTEALPPTPSNNHKWIAGAWIWNEADDDWEWEDGSWQVPPTPDYEWQPPKYEKRGENPVFVPGFWIDPSKDNDSNEDETPPTIVIPPVITPGSGGSTEPSPGAETDQTPNVVIPPVIIPGSANSDGDATHHPGKGVHPDGHTIPIKPIKPGKQKPGTPGVKPAKPYTPAQGKVAPRPSKTKKSVVKPVHKGKIPPKLPPRNATKTPRKPGPKPVAPPVIRSKSSVAPRGVTCEKSKACNCNNKCDGAENKTICADCK